MYRVDVGFKMCLHDLYTIHVLKKIYGYILFLCAMDKDRFGNGAKLQFKVARVCCLG